MVSEKSEAPDNDLLERRDTRDRRRGVCVGEVVDTGTNAVSNDAARGDNSETGAYGGTRFTAHEIGGAMKRAFLILPFVWMCCFAAHATDHVCRPTADANTLWADYGYADIDEAVTQPTAGDGLDNYADQDDDDERQAYTCSKPVGSYATVTQVVVWVYTKKVGSPGAFTVGFQTNSTWYMSSPITLTTSYAWYSATLTAGGPWTKAQIDAQFELGVMCGTMPTGSNEIYVDTLYVVATTMESGFVPTIVIY